MPRRSRPLLLLLLVSLLTPLPLATSAAASASVVRDPGTFVDDDHSRFEPFIERASLSGLVRGCNPPVNDRFCPHLAVTRAEMALMLDRVVDNPPATGDHFEDDNGHPAEDAIGALAEAGVIRGCAEKRFCPDRPLSRGEMAALISRTLEWPEPEGTYTYQDLDGSPLGPAVALLGQRGALEPCDPPLERRMCPDLAATREEAAFALTSALDLAPLNTAARGVEDLAVGFADGFDSLALWDGRSPGSRNRVSLTDDGFRGEGLRVTIPKGSHFGSDFKLDLSRVAGEEPELLFFRYFIRLDSDWAPRSSGKLPGFSGVYGRSGKGGYRSSASSPGWSARLQFFGTHPSDSRARLGYYVYHLGQERQYGDGMMWNEAGKLQPGEWYCVEGEVGLNTPGLADGALRAWVDGTPAFDVAGLEFRRPDEPNIRIESFWFDVYYGGKPVAEQSMGMTVDEVAVDTQRIGCGAGRAHTRSVMGDVTGDGLADRLWWGSCPGGTCFQLQPAGAVAQPVRMGDGGWFSLETHQMGIATGDLDGDGREDVIYRGRCEQSTRCWRVHRSRGTTLGPGGNWGDGARLPPSAATLITGDWNGDGLDDIAYQGLCGSDTKPCWRVRLSTGRRLGEPFDWGPLPPTMTSPPVAADLTGDGRDDILYPAPCGESTCWMVRRSTGESFDEATRIGKTRDVEVDTGRLFDLDEDGDVDLISVRLADGVHRVEVREMGADGLGSPRMLAEFKGEVTDVQPRSNGEEEPVEAMVTTRCDGESSCVRRRLYLSGALLSPPDYREATRIRRANSALQPRGPV